jgi:hypothetical protein
MDGESLDYTWSFVANKQKGKRNGRKNKERRKEPARPSPEVSKAAPLPVAPVPVAPAPVPADDAGTPPVSPEAVERTAPPEAQAPPVSRHTRERMRTRLRVRKIFRALYAMGALALALLVFWPKVSISMEPRDDALMWLYTVRNDGLLPITNLTKVDAPLLLIIRPCIDKGTLAVGNGKESACGTETVPVLRPGDQHTFQCLVPTFVPPTDQVGGSVELRADYRYLRFIRTSTTACFEYAPKADGLPRYLRRACSTPARTLPSDC